ncbi:hypothetical protein PsYK624_023970 [Phanerochaete sordida]|uniref:SNF5-domain-containing protein n=1 Tax=Phanerochaete sordida TaxID=48140 RepID=A0A9P3FZU7_9APHY|nr:hypothetical protein PsYK624_023970 [Phanerochaete sordida]
MNTQAGQHHNPAMLAALQQQQQQHGQMNPNMMNMSGMNSMSGMNPTQQQQLQQMLAAKYQGAGMGMSMGGGSGGGGGFNPQMMQQFQQQHQGGGGGAGGSMGVNPQALMNMGGMNMNTMPMGGMNGRGSIGGNPGFNPQMLAQQQQQQFNQASGRPGTGGGVNPQMLMQQHNSPGAGGMGGPSAMNNMSNGGGMNNMGGMNGGMMGGMNMSGMGGMGGINPQALNISGQTGGGSQNPGSASSPQPPHTQPTSINPATLNAGSGTPSNMAMNFMSGMGPGSMSNLQLTPAQVQQLSHMSPQERHKAMQRLMMLNLQHQQQREMQMRRNSGELNMAGMGGMGMQGQGQGQGQRSQMGAQGQGMDGMMGGMSNNFNAGLSGGMGGMDNSGMMGMDNMGMGGMGMQGMGGGMGGMQGMSGMQGMNAAQLQQMQLLQAQHSQGQERPQSSMSQAQGQHSSPTQPYAFPGQGQSQASSPVRAQTPQQQHNMHMQQQMQQQQHHPNAGMMGPPSSIPPRPPTTAPAASPAPRQGSAMGHPNQYGQHPQHQQPHNYQLGHAQSPRPTGPAAAPSPAAISRTGSSMGMQQHPQGVQQGQQQHQNAQQQQHQGQQGLPAPSPVPIQPRPIAPTSVSGSPAPTPRPGTSQSMHGPGGLRAITPALVGSRPSTATGFRPQPSGQPGQQPGTPQSMQGPQFQTQQQQALQQNQLQGQPQQQVHTPVSTPTSATYPPIAPAPAAGSLPGSPRAAMKRKPSGTPVPQSAAGPASGQGQQADASQGQALAPGQTQGAQGMPGANMTPAQLMAMRMGGGMPAGNTMGPQGANGLMAGNNGVMGIPALPRTQSGQQQQQSAGAGMSMPGMNGMQGPMGANGMQVPGMARQPSAGDLRANTMIAPGTANAAGLSINTNINSNLNPNLNAPMPLAGTPSSPNPTMLVDSTITGAPATPNRNTSQPPTAGSPFPGGMMGTPGSAERKMAGPGVLAGAAPLSRAPTGDVFSGPSAAAATTTTTPAANGAAAPAAQGTTQIIPQLPPLPTNVSLNPKVTRVSVVPLKDSETTIPALKQEEIERMKRWMKADDEYEARYKQMRERMTEEVREAIIKPRPWYEKDPQEDPRARRRKEKFDLVGVKGREEMKRKKAGRREGFKLPRTVNPEDASRPEQLVPIRLEFDVDHHKMRDTFIWNLNDPIITPEIFAQSIVDDYSLAPNYHSVITKTIQDQLSDFKAHTATFGEDGFDDVVMRGQLAEEDDMWWDAWRNHVRSDTLLRPWEARSERRTRKRRKIVKDEEDDSKTVPAAPGLDAYMSVDEFEEDESKTLEEMRILIKLDIIVGSVKLEDQFEWDLDTLDPSPEHFADIYATDLGLGGEFKTAIAHAIREQVQIYQKSLFLVGHPSDGSAVQDDDLRLSLLPSLSTGARSMDQVVAFTPRLDYLSDGELERNEKEREKELNRRRRKTTRGRRGIALPDREPPKTYRTPAIGFPEVDPATLALANAAIAPTSRRAAAAAASHNIASMIASENGTSLSPQAMPVPVPAAISATPSQPTKEKKPKGLMKPPSYPPHVLRPRAHVKAPTDWTAADPMSVDAPLDIDPPVSTNVENRGARVPLSAKRAKELEREAKEREYVDGQHPNIIDGIWHCSNCGCPESIAIGRRKGPLGDKSQCGTCGKFWHRHRRPRPVEYNSSLEYHMNLKKEEEMARLAASRRKRPHQHIAETSSKAPTVEPETPKKRSPEPDSKPVSRSTALETPKLPKLEKLEVGSPMSTTSSISEAPLAKTKTNGVHSTPSAPAMAPSQSESSEGIQDTPQDAPAALPSVAPLSAGARAGVNRPARDPPAWLKTAMKELNDKYPDDRFEAVLRRGPNPAQPEWRIKCTDCPGKLYTPGPDETLTNYEVHLKNRQHRQKVNARVEKKEG